MASAMGVSQRRVNQLADLRIIKRVERGQYDLFASLTGYIVFLHEAMSKKSTMDAQGNIKNSTDQRARLLEVEIATAEIDLAAKRGQVMALDDHKMIIGNLILETKARVMTIGARAAPKVQHEKSRSAIKKVIDAEALDALIAMSKVPFSMPGMPVLSEDAPDSPAARKSAKARKTRARAKKKPKSKRKTVPT